MTQHSLPALTALYSQVLPLHSSPAATTTSGCGRWTAPCWCRLRNPGGVKSAGHSLTVCSSGDIIGVLAAAVHVLTVSEGGRKQGRSSKSG